MVLRIAVPNKGRLNERAVELLVKSGLDLGEDWGRKLYVKVLNKDIEVIFVRAQDIPTFISSGAVDIGITGQDQIANAGVDVEGSELGVGEVNAAHDGALAEAFVYAVDGALRHLAPLFSHDGGVEGELYLLFINEV